jgi:aldose 1-epimerase
MNIITLNNDTLSLQCRLQGAVILNLVADDGQSILRPALNPLAEPGECAMFPLLPLANRVAGNAFPWQGRRIALPRSPYDERFFLHGDGWLRTWRMLDLQPDAVTLDLDSWLPGMYRYHATACYQLQANALLATLNITNTADSPFPFGLGFHPFLAKTAAMRLSFPAQGYWPEQEYHLPGEWHSGLPADLDFTSPRIPGSQWINNAFSGWRGNAELADDDAIVTLRGSTDILMVYQPEQSDFICLEPQTHPVNAHNLPGYPGLAILEPEQSLNLTISISRSVLAKT